MPVVMPPISSRRPDSFGQGPDGEIYVTTSHIRDNMCFDPNAGPAIRIELWRAEEQAAG